MTDALDDKARLTNAGTNGRLTTHPPRNTEDSGKTFQLPKTAAAQSADSRSSKDCSVNEANFKLVRPGSLTQQVLGAMNKAIDTDEQGKERLLEQVQAVYCLARRAKGAINERLMRGSVSEGPPVPVLCPRPRSPDARVPRRPTAWLRRGKSFPSRRIVPMAVNQTACSQDGRCISAYCIHSGFAGTRVFADR